MHTFSWTEFDLLARSEGGPDLVRRLRTADRSRRLLLLRDIIDKVAAAPALRGPLPSPEQAWDLLVLAQETDPDALDEVLAHPYTGSWAGHTTRLLRQLTTDPRPLWVHIGHVHALAAAAAVRARIDTFQVRVPVWRGDVALPTLGLAQLGSAPEAETAELKSAGGRIEIVTGDHVVVLPADPSADAPGWRGIRTAELGTGRRRFSVRLDDVDPYRGLFGPSAPDRLAPADLDTWRGLLAQAWDLIVRLLPEFADALPAGLDTIVPRPRFPFRLPSASSGEAFGSALICQPEDPVTLAAALVHEFQHIRLGGLLQLVRLHTEDRTERLYAPWRDDPRPLGGVVHGIYAFFAVTEFYRALSTRQPDDELAAFEYAHWRHQVARTLDTVRADKALTEPGQRFLALVAERAGTWQNDEVLATAAHWSDLVAADHYAGFRLRHLRPEPEAIELLVDSWLRGTPGPGIDGVGTELVTEPDGDWANARADLLRVRLGEDGARRATALWREVPGASEADFALVDGRGQDAIELYRTALRADPDAPAALIGLGLALRTTGDPAAAAVLLDRPEVVRAVLRGIRRRPAPEPAPEEVARWLAEAR
ncbi:HEXXH motif-containing protein [Amycolatopsis lexingtonensis]|uniref:HEXXH motif-containing protein n=1 Tax=Amycolatopsis lexingtonensis TaxID=218822 RepID=A0ABR9IDG8_9PSEU|nr:HEXXH motif-containing putative peptide modification protein [Amycolatopsis lexingtonensis]MBE1501205.1 HEXXH motif-containing protein [Amycolatopsis lexingtonensis]